MLYIACKQAAIMKSCRTIIMVGKVLFQRGELLCMNHRFRPLPWLSMTIEWMCFKLPTAPVPTVIEVSRFQTPFLLSSLRGRSRLSSPLTLLTPHQSVHRSSGVMVKTVSYIQHNLRRGGNPRARDRCSGCGKDLEVRLSKHRASSDGRDKILSGSGELVPWK
jgi:hypothetical protein